MKSQIGSVLADRKFCLLITYCIFGPAVFAGFLFGRARGHPFWMVFIIAVAVMTGVVFTVVGLIMWLGRKTDQQLKDAENAVARIHRETNELPASEAERRAIELLRNPSRCKCVRAKEPRFPMQEELPPLLRRFLQDYESVRLIDAGTVAREFVRRSRKKLRGEIMLRIGEGDEDSLLAIQPGMETIHLIDSISDTASTGETFPTIFHWLVAEAATQDYFAVAQS